MFFPKARVSETPSLIGMDWKIQFENALWVQFYLWVNVPSVKEKTKKNSETCRLGRYLKLKLLSCE